MPLPNKPLIIKDYDVEELTLDESRVIFGDTYVVEDFRQFLIDHVDHEKSWTEKEIGKIKRKELSDVRAAVYNAIRELALPLVSPPPSGDGRGGNETTPATSPDSPGG
jgi:hypothetical protein